VFHDWKSIRIKEEEEKDSILCVDSKDTLKATDVCARIPTRDKAANLHQPDNNRFQCLKTYG